MASRPTVAVYAIALNEAWACERFYASCAGADLVVVADAGSTDGTPALLRRLGAMVHEIRVLPWRFDVARNAALSLLPAEIDVCIALDMDEVLAPGWREAIDRAWDPELTRLQYEYAWNWKADGTPGLVFLADKIHARAGYCWVYPCHEVLHHYGSEAERFTRVPGLRIDHHADATKSRAQYLDLLEIGVGEYPDSARPAFNYGRELFYYQRWEDAIRELERYLALPDSTWLEERSQAMVFLARCYVGLENPDEGMRWVLKAVAECPNRREVWCALAEEHFRRQDWAQCYAACLQTLKIQENTGNWLWEDRAWGPVSHDLAAVAAYNMGLYHEAYEQGCLAVERDPEDPRLRANLQFYASGAVAPKSWGEKSIVYFASQGGESFEKWSPKSLEWGTGGSERAVIELARRWAADGYEVTVFGDPREDAGTHDGVVYRPWYEINWKDAFNILILWRSPYLLDKPIAARKLFVDLHDVVSDWDWTPERMAKVDKVFFKSRFHRSLLAALPEEKAVVLSNGV